MNSWWFLTLCSSELNALFKGFTCIVHLSTLFPHIENEFILFSNYSYRSLLLCIELSVVSCAIACLLLYFRDFHTLYKHVSTLFPHLDKGFTLILQSFCTVYSGFSVNSHWFLTLCYSVLTAFKEFPCIVQTPFYTLFSL